MKRVASVLLVIVSAHLLLFYLNFAIRYSATVGVEQVARESKLAGNLALLFLGVTIALQFVTAWLLKPGRLPAPTTTGSAPQIHISESFRPEPWERYWILLVASAASTLAIFGLLLFVATRTNYDYILLQFLGLAER